MSYNQHTIFIIQRRTLFHSASVSFVNSKSVQTNLIMYSNLDWHWTGNLSFLQLTPLVKEKIVPANINGICVFTIENQYVWLFVLMGVLFDTYIVY